MLTDSHCHLASGGFQPPEVSGLIGSALAADVGRMVTLATCLDDIGANLEIARNPAVHACIGIHPCDVHRAPDDVMRRLAAFTEDGRVCAVGETGLDYHHPPPDGWTATDFRERQREMLHHHFELAAAAGLNVVIHTRDREGRASFEDAMTICRGFHGRVRAVFHCFAGSRDEAWRVVDLGGLVSFGGIVTFKNAGEVRNTALHCPPGSFMLETDAPYLAPEPHRGKRNEPARVRDTAMFLAALRGETLEELAHHTSLAAAAFFRFRPSGN